MILSPLVTLCPMTPTKLAHLDGIVLTWPKELFVALPQVVSQDPNIPKSSKDKQGLVFHVPTLFSWLGNPCSDWDAHKPLFTV